MVGWSPQCYIPSFVEIGPPVPEKKIFEGFLPYRGLAAIFVKVTPGSSFEQTMMGWSPGCYIPSFVEISQQVTEKIFEGFFTTYGRGGHLVHVTSIMSSDFHFLVPESFHTKFGSDRHCSF